jgi:molecular chaperone GrpE
MFDFKMFMSKKEKFNDKDAKKPCNCGCGHDHNNNPQEDECVCTEDGACFCEDEKSSCQCDMEKAFLQSEIEKLKNEAKENHENFLRALADLDTFRRRVQRDMEDMRKFSIQPLVEELIPALDNLELGLAHAKNGENGKELVVGIEMVLTQIKKVFENFGVIEISPLGQDFDPNLHDSVAHSPSDEYAENKVSAIMRKGYTLNGRLVRPASVVVSSGAKKEE